MDRDAVSIRFSVLTNEPSTIYSVGAFAERARLAPVLVFAFFWATIAYSAFVHWVWNADGWSAKLGDMDFAGGGPVHMSSGAAALAISIFLGKRRGYRTEILAYRPQNVGYIFLGTTLLWVYAFFFLNPLFGCMKLTNGSQWLDWIQRELNRSQDHDNLI